MCSIDSMRGGKIAKSSVSTPGVVDWDCNTRKIERSGWSELTEPIALNRRRSYLYGTLLPCQATTARVGQAVGADHAQIG